MQDGQQALGRQRLMDHVTCWHCDERGHTQTNCPQLKAQEGVEADNVGVDNLNIHKSDKEHGLLVCKNAGVDMLQSRPSAEPVKGILSAKNLYVDTHTVYASTLYAHLLTDVKEE